MISKSNNKNLQVSFLVFCSLLIFLGRQLDTGITNFDDAYYAQKAKEILESGSYWLITYAGKPIFDNPPLPFWFTAWTFSIFGISSYSAIFPSALLATGTVFLTYRLSLLLFKDYWIAFASAFVLLFPGGFVDSGRRGMVDIPLAFFVLLAFFAVFKAKNFKPWYLVFGFSTAGAILTKSILGLFPIAITGVFFILNRQWREIMNPWFLVGVVISIALGFSWHLINWQHYGPSFTSTHFSVLIFDRGFGNIQDPFYFLGYAKDFLRNYWPWLPFAVVGLIQFGRRGLQEKDNTSLLLFLWPTLTFLVMSTSKNHTIRYLFMIFPALAIIVAKTISQWLEPKRKGHALAAMVLVIALTTLFINATPFQAKVSLLQSSKEVRELAATINLNTPPDQKLGNYRLPAWNPRMAMLFYSDRIMDTNVTQSSDQLMKDLASNPAKTWLTSIEDFRKLKIQNQDKVYLVQANSKYAFFTSIENRENIRYDFSEMHLPIAK